MLRFIEKILAALSGRVILSATLLFVAAACRPGVPGSTADPQTSPEGCWELALAVEGAQVDSVRNWLPRGTLPAVIELDTTRTSRQASEDSSRAAYSWFDGRREKDPFSLWRPMRGDSLLVQRAGARAGLALRVVHSEDRLEGVVVSFSDIRTQNGDDRSQAAVEATQTDCPEPQSMNPMRDKPE